MSLETFMLQALQRATETARTDGIVRPTFVIVSPEGIYHLVCPTEQSLRSESDMSLQVVSALLRWSMARAFVVTCTHEIPKNIAVYVVTVDGTEGFSIRMRKNNRLQFGSIKRAVAPPYVSRLSALIPPPISELSAQDIMDLEETFGMELEDCQPYYLS
jgi:hypothetical protein